MSSLKNIRAGYRQVNMPNENVALWLQTLTTGKIVMGMKDSLVRLGIGEENIQLDLSKCSLEELENLFQMIESLKSKIITENSQNVVAFRDTELAFRNNPEYIRKIILYCGNFLASLQILIRDRRIVLNPLKKIKKGMEDENIFLGFIQGIFIALIQKLKKTEKDEDRKIQYDRIIASSRALIRRLGQVKKNQESQIKLTS